MSLEAERNIIGSLITRTECLDEIANLLTPEMFSSDLYGKAYYEALQRIPKGKAYDLPTLIQILQDDAYSENAVKEELRSCLLETETTATVKSYARILADEYASDKLSALSRELVFQPNTIRHDIEVLKSAIDDVITPEGYTLKPLAKITAENKDHYFKDENGKKILTGLKGLDEIIGGFDGGDMIIIGARPSVGKSAYAMQLAMHLCEENLKVGYFNLEMQEKQIYERFVAAKSGIEITRIRRATRYLEGEKEAFDKANEYLSSVDRIMISTGSKKMSQIKAECRGQNFDVIIIDYLQLVRADGRYRGNRYAEVGEISHSAKAMAMDMNIPVIALCQLNRGSEGRDNKEPFMSDLRESGDFEQDASTILLLYNTDENDKSKKCIKVEKNRQGKTGKINLVFDGNKMRFTEEQNNYNGWNSNTDFPFDV